LATSDVLGTGWFGADAANVQPGKMVAVVGDGAVGLCAVLAAKMTTGSKDELHKIAQADDLHISPFRDDGVTYGTPTWIWSVAVDDALYVRGYNGQNSRWYQAAVRQKAGRIIAAGMVKEVMFEPVDGPIKNRNR
jgi:hypothetical protein